MDDIETVAETREDLQPVVASSRTAKDMLHELTEPSIRDVTTASIHAATAPNLLEKAKEKLHDITTNTLPEWQANTEVRV